MIRLPALPVTDERGPVPKIVHHIWADPPQRIEPMPAWVKRQADHWVERWLPEGWRYVMWTTEMVMDHPLLARTASLADELSLPPRGLSDLLRPQILSLWGGLYLDVDVLPLGDLDALVSEPTICTSAGPGKRTLDQWGTAFPTGHPLQADLQEYALEALGRGVRDEHSVAGPQALRRVWDTNGYPDVRVIWDCEYSGTAQVREARRSGDLSGLVERYPGVPLLPTYGDFT